MVGDARTLRVGGFLAVHPLINPDAVPVFTLARVMIKTSLVFFCIGLLSGLYLYGSRIFGWTAPHTLPTAHGHMLLMGGVVLMILGVATWLFPRRRKDRTPTAASRAWMLYYGLAGATVLRFAFEIASPISESMLLAQVSFLMALFQVACAGGLGLLLWIRIRPIGSHLREQSGEKFS